MTTDKKQISAQVVSLALVFGVGILVGQQFCAPTAVEPEVLDCPPQTPKIVEYCPPDPIIDEEPQDLEESVEDIAPDPPRERASTGSALPESPPPTTPQQRRQLLGWARGQASTLQGCPRDLGTTYRLAITLGLDEDGEVNKVTINTDEDDLSGDLQQCLQERILRWKIPADIAPSQDRLVFRLTI